MDLSFNNLADLYNTINVLKTLPKLKNLVLQGNPLAVSFQIFAILPSLGMTLVEQYFETKN